MGGFVKLLCVIICVFVLGCASKQDVDTTHFSLTDFYLYDETFAYHLSESVNTVPYSLNRYTVREGETWRYRDCRNYGVYGGEFYDFYLGITKVHEDTICIVEGMYNDTLLKLYDTTTILLKENYPDLIKRYDEWYRFNYRGWFEVLPIPYDSESISVEAIVMDDGTCWYRTKTDTSRIYSSKYGLVAELENRNSKVLIEHNRETVVLGYQLREFLAKEEALEK